MPLKSGHHRPTSKTTFKMAFRLPADDDPTLNADLVALCDFSGDPDQSC